jgi:hypothetical protein
VHVPAAGEAPDASDVDLDDDDLMGEEKAAGPGPSADKARGGKPRPAPTGAGGLDSRRRK